MKDNIEFLTKLRNQSITLWIDGDKLRFRSVANAMTDEIKDELKRRKPELMRLLQQSQREEELPLVPADRSGLIPLTHAQQRLWFLHKLNPADTAYNVYDVIELNHVVNIDALHQALTEVVRRHEILRTIFPDIDGEPYQKILPAGPVSLPLLDLSSLDNVAREREVQHRTMAEMSKPFSLIAEPPLRVQILKLASDSYIWLLSIHHIASDDWSKKILNHELEALYTAYCKGQKSPLADLPIQWADFSIWQHKAFSGAKFEAHAAYWKKQLSGEIKQLKFIEEEDRTIVANGRNGKFYLSSVLTKKIRAFCEREDVTMYMVFLAAYACLLSRYTQQKDIIIGTPISDRHKVETEQLIGFFLNTLPMRIQIEKGMSFRALLDQVKQRALDAYTYISVPYESLMADLNVERTANGSPLFQCMLSLLNTPDIKPEYSNLWGENTSEPFPQLDGELGIYVADKTNGSAMFDLAVMFIEHPQGIWGKTEYNGNVFSEKTIATFIERLQIFLHSALENPFEIIDKLSIITHAQRKEILGSWSLGYSLALKTTLVHQIVEQQAIQSPMSTAIESYNGVCITYSQLNKKANQLANYLIKQGVSIESKVAILLERSIDQFVALLAVLKTGGCYVPLDTIFPSERKKLICKDAGVELIISTEALLLDAGIGNLTLIDMGIIENSLALESTENPITNVSENDTACVLYTSGSTGRPKGVEVMHHGIVNYCAGAATDCKISSEDRILQFGSISFDGHLEEAFDIFYVGGTLVLRSEEMIGSTIAFIRYCERMKITILNLPTAYWHELVSILDQQSLPEFVRCVILGGERVKPEKLVQWQRAIGSRINLYNTYGPTEGSIAATRALFSDNPDQSFPGKEVSIGRPVANISVYILNDVMEIVPEGIPGEVYIGGIAVTRGYLNQPDLTAERFVNNPFETASRLYRTGDMARYMADGSLQYLGRIDSQVKIRGYRVELREIESVIQTHDAIKDVVVAAITAASDTIGLVAYYVLKSNHFLNNNDLRDFLKSQHTLPDYMIPSGYMELDSLPLTSNGKINRQALPAFDVRKMQKEYFPPRNKLEKLLSEVWQSLLGIEKIGIRDSFFDLGGHSLLIIRLIANLQREGIELTVQNVIRSPTIEGLVEIIQLQDLTNDYSYRYKNGDPIYSLPNKQFLFKSTFNNDWAMKDVINIKNSNEFFLEKSIRELLVNNDIFRHQFYLDDGFVFEKLIDDFEEKILVVIDLSKISDNQEKLLEIDRITSNYQSELNLKNNLYKFILFKIGNGGKDIFIWMVHHALLDGYSKKNLFGRELSLRYLSYISNIEYTPLKKTNTMTEWANYLRHYINSQDAQQDIDYWVSRPWGREGLIVDDLDGITKNKTNNGALHGVDYNVVGRLDSKSSELLLNRNWMKEAFTPADIILSSFVSMVAKLSQAPWVRFDLVANGRDKIMRGIDLSNTMGWAADYIPVFIEVDNKKSSVEHMRSYRNQYYEIPSSGYSFGGIKYLHDDASVRNTFQNIPWGEFNINFEPPELSNLTDNEIDERLDTTILSVSDISFGKNNNEATPIEIIWATYINIYYDNDEFIFRWYTRDNIYRKEAVERAISVWMDEIRCVIEQLK